MNKHLKVKQIIVEWVGLYMVQLNWIVFGANKEIIFKNKVALYYYKLKLTSQNILEMLMLQI